MNFWTTVGVGVLALLWGGVIGVSGGYDKGYSETMKEAYDRGFAVQCVGKVGYYWECEE